MKRGVNLRPIPRYFWFGELLAAASLLVVMMSLASRTFAEETGIEAPNVITISPRVVTSGQPTATSLSRLHEQGFGAVIFLAPINVAYGVPEEAEIIRNQGLTFIEIPVNFDRPTGTDIEEFVRAMQSVRDHKVLVHCQVNMGASTMTFLYRVIVDSEKLELAYEAVAQVWSPRGPLKNLLVTALRKAAIDFEPY